MAQLNESAFNVFYNAHKAPDMEDPLLAHQLSLLYMILAIGSLMDVTRPAYNVEAEKYHHLARAALFQSPIFEEPTLIAVQSLVRLVQSVARCSLTSNHSISWRSTSSWASATAPVSARGGHSWASPSS